ncbi:MAG TPA: JAB domain-containing protein [Sphingomicrobium sp.]|nr:JAB domain-containing protein [Sphingomicrobium sp.]
MRAERAHYPAILAGHAAACSFFEACFDERSQYIEQLWVAHVDESARCIHLSRHQGGECDVNLPIRSIIADAARLGSAGVVLAHNHPSGDSTPSLADCRATRSLARAAEAIDLAVVDHLIFAEGSECHSLRRMGLL